MNIWVVLYRTGWIAITVLVIVLIVSIFVPQIQHYQELRRKEAVLQEEIRLEEEMLRHLKEQQERLRTDPRFVEKVAREEFGYIRPGETVFKFVDDGKSTNGKSR
ncbi:MAG: Cell division protein FtsL [Verrucomicrobia bacterium ADurb.Bin345]|nr:MAG: Cell division protein FtsL [Verrucomicrobia bacterium ADurb.Bin345]